MEFECWNAAVVLFPNIRNHILLGNQLKQAGNKVECKSFTIKVGFIKDCDIDRQIHIFQKLEPWFQHHPEKGAADI